MLALSETFGRADQPSVLSPIDGYATWNSERSGRDKGGGGLTMLYKKTLTAHQWSPPVTAPLKYIENERQWLLVEGSKERCAFLHVYIACQTTRNDNYMQWNEDLFYLISQEAIKLRREGFIVLALGDFNSRVGQIDGLQANTPDTNTNTPMFLNFITQVNLVIINTLPIAKGLFTRFMNNTGQPGSKSLLDYGLIDNEHVGTVTSFVIDEMARHACGSDHALLECKIVFTPIPNISWSYNEAVQYDIRPNTNYTEYQKHLDITASTIPLSKLPTMTTDQILPHISESINTSAMKIFGLKIKKQKGGRKLPRSIINSIRAKNELATLLHNTRQDASFEEVLKLEHQLDTQKAEIKDSISNFMINRRHRLRCKLLHADPTRKKFWRFLKNQIKSAGNISAVYNKTGQMVFEQEEIEDAVLHHFGLIFKGKRHPVTEAHPYPSSLQTNNPNPP